LSFLSASPKRSDLLGTACSCIVPKSVVTQWNFQSKDANLVYINKDSLLECFDITENANRLFFSFSLVTCAHFVQHLAKSVKQCNKCL
jgi:hypothetical protein